MRIGPPQPALNVDMDAYTNVDTIHFSFENRDRTQPVLEVQIPDTTVWIPVPLPDVSLGEIEDDADQCDADSSGEKDRQERCAETRLGLVGPLPQEVLFHLLHGGDMLP